eukprot:1018323-Rhodomonas_salina.3
MFARKYVCTALAATVFLASIAAPASGGVLSGLPSVRSDLSRASVLRSGSLGRLYSQKNDDDTVNDPDTYIPQEPTKSTLKSCASLRMSLRGGAPVADPPLMSASPERLQIVFVSAEIAPWSITGGLGAVCDGLPRALAKLGHRVMSIAPRYDQYYDAWDT